MLLGLSLTFLASQIFAGIAMISDIISFQCKERKKIIIFFIISSFCIAVQYFFLERYVPAMISLLGTLRFFVSYHSSDTRWAYFFITLSCLVTFSFYKDSLDLLILVASIFANISVFQKDDRYLRIIMMLATLCFITYNALIFTPISLLLECIFLGSNLVGYYRYYILKKL